MSAPTKDEAVRAVVGELDGLIAQLRGNVDALTAILTAPPPPPSGDAQEVPAR